jgi:hypothetical protein
VIIKDKCSYVQVDAVECGDKPGIPASYPKRK